MTARKPSLREDAKFLTQSNQKNEMITIGSPVQPIPPNNPTSLAFDPSQSFIAFPSTQECSSILQDSCDDNKTRLLAESGVCILPLLRDMSVLTSSSYHSSSSNAGNISKTGISSANEDNVSHKASQIIPWHIPLHFLKTCNHNNISDMFCSFKIGDRLSVAIINEFSHSSSDALDSKSTIQSYLTSWDLTDHFNPIIQHKSIMLSHDVQTQDPNNIQSMRDSNIHAHITCLLIPSMEASFFGSISAGYAHVLIGTVDGRVLMLDALSGSVKNYTIPCLARNLVNDCDSEYISVSCLSLSPVDPNLLLIGYGNGSLFIWDINKKITLLGYNVNALITNNPSESHGIETSGAPNQLSHGKQSTPSSNSASLKLMAASWHPKGTEIVTSHAYNHKNIVSFWNVPKYASSSDTTSSILFGTLRAISMSSSQHRVENPQYNEIFSHDSTNVSFISKISWVPSPFNHSSSTFLFLLYSSGRISYLEMNKNKPPRKLSTLQIPLTMKLESFQGTVMDFMFIAPLFTPLKSTASNATNPCIISLTSTGALIAHEFCMNQDETSHSNNLDFTPVSIHPSLDSKLIYPGVIAVSSIYCQLPSHLLKYILSSSSFYVSKIRHIPSYSKIIGTKSIVILDSDVSLSLHVEIPPHAGANKGFISNISLSCIGKIGLSKFISHCEVSSDFRDNETEISLYKRLDTALSKSKDECGIWIVVRLGSCVLLVSAGSDEHVSETVDDDEMERLIMEMDRVVDDVLSTTLTNSNSRPVISQEDKSIASDPVVDVPSYDDVLPVEPCKNQVIHDNCATYGGGHTREEVSSSVVISFDECKSEHQSTAMHVMFSAMHESLVSVARVCDVLGL